MRVDAVVDRVEGDLAVLEVDGRTVDWPLALLPEGTAEGTALSFEVAIASASVDDAAARLARLRARTPQSGDVDL